MSTSPNSAPMSSNTVSEFMVFGLFDSLDRGGFFFFFCKSSKFHESTGYITAINCFFAQLMFFSGFRDFMAQL